MQIQRVLVPTAFDDTSKTAVLYARELAVMFRAELHILHVVPDAAREPWAGQVVGIELDDLTAAWRCDADDRVHQWARECGIGPAAVIPVVRQGNVADAILAYAAEQRIDVIVLGAGPRRPLVHAFRGRTRDRVIRKAACPVVSVPSQPAGASAESDRPLFEVTT